MQGNILGQSGSSTGLNIFAQPNEPSKKDGIWIKTDEKYKFENIQFVDDYNLIENNYAKLPTFDVGTLYPRSITKIGSNIYLGTSEGMYIYNTLTGLYTKMNSDLVNNGLTSVGSDIYTFSMSIFGSYEEYELIKYNTITNDKTIVKEGSYISFDFLKSIGSNIYLFGYKQNRR